MFIPTLFHFKEKFNEVRAVDLKMEITKWLTKEKKWLDVFECAYKVCRFQYTHTRYDGTLLALSQYEPAQNEALSSPPPASSVEFPLFPALETLVISSAYATKRDDGIGAFGDQLLHLLQVRQECGAAIREVVIDESLAGFDFWYSIRKEVLVTVM
jgi:hypothetical protein